MRPGKFRCAGRVVSRRAPSLRSRGLLLLTLLGLACGGGDNNRTPVTPGTPRITPGELRGLEIFLERDELRVGQVLGPALAYGRYDDGTTAVVEGVWASSDPLIVEAGESGALTGVAVGRATVSASFKEYEDSVVLTVVAPNPRYERDQPDDRTGSQIHAVYALPSDVEDGNLDRFGDIERSLASIQHWLTDEIGHRLHLDTAAGAPDVTFLGLPFTAQEGEERGESLLADLAAAIESNSGTSPDKLYAVYYAGRFGDRCGSAAVEGRVAAIFLDPDGCSPAAVGGDEETASTYEAVMVHALLHLFGAVPECAPARLETSPHVGDDVQDLMYAGTEWARQVEAAIDPGRDDYFRHGLPDCLDVSASDFWAPVERTEAPRGAAWTPRLQIPSEDWPIRCALRDLAASPQVDEPGEPQSGERSDARSR